jgi:hypothetical protein
MDDKRAGWKKHATGLLWKATKATIKGIIAYAIYFVAWSFLSPLSQYIPSLQQMIETFIAIYIVLMILGELTSGTIYQHFFNAAKALFVIAYMLMSLKGGIFSLSVDNMNLTIDLRLFLVATMLLGLLGFAKTILQAIDYMNQKAEPRLLKLG